MIGRLVEIAQDNRHLSADRGFLVVSHQKEPLGKVPLDDIAGVLCAAHGITYSNNLLVSLAERNIPLVVSAQNFSPVCMLWPIEGHHEQAGRMDDQIAAGKPLRKRLWASIVRSKLENQAAVLRAIGQPDAALVRLASKVKSGDPENLEAQGARHYWQRVLGRNFRRHQDADGDNALLNYGYSVLRTSTARAVAAAGLHPSLGLHHSNRQNTMRLVDDLMEPFRPLIDMRVYALDTRRSDGPTPETKRHLVETLSHDLSTEDGVSPLSVCIHRLALSLAQVFSGQRKVLELPPIPSRMDMAALMQG